MCIAVVLESSCSCAACETSALTVLVKLAHSYTGQLHLLVRPEDNTSESLGDFDKHHTLQNANDKVS